MPSARPTLADLDAVDEFARSFAAGYRLGYAAGYEIGWHRGYGDSEREMDAAWHAVAVKVRAVLRQPLFAELQRRRGEPS